MGSLSVPLSYSYDSGVVLTASELRKDFLQGVPLKVNGQPMSMNILKTYIERAQSYIETLLDLKLTRQLITEWKDYSWNDFRNWGYIPCTYPVICLKEIKGYVGDVHVVNFPKEWVRRRSTISSSGVGDYHSRNIFLIPSLSGSSFYTTYTYAYDRVSPMSNYSSMNFASNLPSHWQLQYYTGWDNFSIPPLLIGIVGKLAAIQALAIAGELVFGLPGVSSSSLSLDGLSQSISTAVSGNSSVYSARINMYGEQLTQELEQIKGFFGSTTLTVL